MESNINFNTMGNYSLLSPWIEKSEFIADISDIGRGRISINRRKYRRYFGVFTDFSGNFPIFLTSPARVQDTRSVQFFFFFFFFFKDKMLFGNLIMICRQRLCSSAWLKNRGFRVREI